MNKIIDKIGIFLIVFLLASCASSKVERNASDKVDSAYQSGNSFFSSAGNSKIGNAYQNSTQTTKGVLIGGTVGAVAGGLVSGIGVGPGAIEGAIWGGALGAYIDRSTTLVDKLKNRNVNVIVLGDQVLLVLPSDEIFNDVLSSTLQPTAYSTLDLVAKLINGYTSMSVKVAVYTSSAGSPETINRSVSQEQANSIVKYLWRRGVNTRLLYAVGAGGTHIVSQDTGDWSEGENYRIEITLEKLPV